MTRTGWKLKPVFSTLYGIFGVALAHSVMNRSEERRVGKEC